VNSAAQFYGPRSLPCPGTISKTNMTRWLMGKPRFKCRHRPDRALLDLPSSKIPAARDLVTLRDLWIEATRLNHKARRARALASVGEN
jgi:hypothetical protein